MDDKDIYLSKEQADKLEKILANNEIPDDFQVPSLTPEDFKKSDNKVLSKEESKEESNVNTLFVTIITLIIFCGFALILKICLKLFGIV